MTSLLFSRLFRFSRHFSVRFPHGNLFDVCQTLLKFSKIQESFYVTI